MHWNTQRRLRCNQTHLLIDIPHCLLQTCCVDSILDHIVVPRSTTVSPHKQDLRRKTNKRPLQHRAIYRLRNTTKKGISYARITHARRINFQSLSLSAQTRQTQGTSSGNHARNQLHFNECWHNRNFVPFCDVFKAFQLKSHKQKPYRNGILLPRTKRF